MTAFSNHLVHETSPYLLQHAHNPVQWYPWGETALQKAIAEDKPILVSIGYAACHWCHVMERESFEDEDTAAFMNKHFINIKIDREERPDLDHIYMNAVQTLTGSGGWPLNVFLTPGKMPFYGGTYFPPKPMYNRPSWQQVLMGVAEAFHERRDKLEESAQKLTSQLTESANFGLSGSEQSRATRETLDTVFNNIMQSADTRYGGFGNAPKFPQPFVIQYLLKYHYYTGNTDALKQALLSLDKMIDGGIYDQLGGGFARYSTDGEWLVPHFEKMLYDNALLLQVLCDAWKITQDELYKDTIAHTFSFVQREMMSPEGGFYSALDADSEGVEGKYYIWSKKEIEAVLGEDAALFCRFYDVTEQGNWEHHNILNVRKPVAEFAGEAAMCKEALKDILEKNKNRLLAERNKRTRPLLDDKILLGWNAMMNTAYSRAFAATGEEMYRKTAERNMQFIFSAFFAGGAWKHGYKDGVASNPAFLDDYACLIEALIRLQEITGNQQYLLQAKDLTEITLANFYDEVTGLFYYTHKGQKDVILRSKEIYDGATPSGNSTMALNLRYLSLIFDNNEWLLISEKMAGAVVQITSRYPTSFGKWACILTGIVHGQNEIAVVGSRYREILADILAKYLPDSVLQSSGDNNSFFPLLKNRLTDGKTNIYLCRGYSCKKPVTSALQLFELMGR
ncbi:MAG: thioredoxin domain-containing protein [Chitinophagaceae bacterium]|nr:thioredoxin domain-containing protein [Chitinophagaceae bacterium]MCW5925985.1 thioredoxin domain-containing protein [Chitinophagaceae bacterium]